MELLRMHMVRPFALLIFSSQLLTLNYIISKKDKSTRLLCLIGQLYGKMALLGKANVMMARLLPFVLDNIHQYEWKQTLWNLIDYLPHNSLDSIVDSLLTQLPTIKQFPLSYKAQIPPIFGFSPSSPSPLYRLQSQVLFDLFGGFIYFSSCHNNTMKESPDIRLNFTKTQTRNGHALSHTFLHKTLFVRLYNLKVLRVVIDFINKVSQIQRPVKMSTDRLHEEIEDTEEISPDKNGSTYLLSFSVATSKRNS